MPPLADRSSSEDSDSDDEAPAPPKTRLQNASLGSPPPSPPPSPPAPPPDGAGDASSDASGGLAAALSYNELQMKVILELLEEPEVRAQVVGKRSIHCTHVAAQLSPCTLALSLSLSCSWRALT